MNAGTERRIIRGLNSIGEGLNNSMLKSICKGLNVLVLAFMPAAIFAQVLTIQNGGQTGTSSTNWSICSKQ